MKKIVFLFALLGLGSIAWAQPRIGKLGIEEMQVDYLQRFPNDEAVRLYAYAEITLEPTADNSFDFQCRTYHYQKIKILSKEGLDYANVEISSSKEERVRGIEAYTYNLEKGELVKEKVKKDAIFSSKESENTNLTKFTFPNVKEGSIIEYTYITEKPYLTTLPSFQFQSRIPCIHSELRTSIPEYFTYIEIPQLYYPFESVDVTHRIGHISTLTYNINEKAWVKKNLPAFKQEKYLRNINDCIDKIDFQLQSYTYPGRPPHSFLTTWQALCDELMEYDNLGKFYETLSGYNDVVNGLVADTLSTKAKSKILYDYVRTRYSWNEENELIAGKPINLKSEKNTSFNSSELNLSLLALLRHAKIPANAVLISTRSHGSINKHYPIVSRFNYVLVYVPLEGDKYLLLDATDKMRPMEMLGLNFINGEGLMIDKEHKYQWIALKGSSKNNKMVSILAILAEDGKLSGSMMTNIQGYEALNIRKKMQNVKSGVSQNDKTEAGTSEHKALKPSEIKFDNLENPEKSLSGKMKFEIEEYAQATEDRIYLNPILDFDIDNLGNAFHFHMEDNPFKAEKRLYDVDTWTPIDETYTFSLNIPAGFEVEELPKKIKMETEDKVLLFDYNVVANEKNITVNVKLLFNRTVFTPEEYEGLRNFMAKVVEKHAEMIVLKRKS